MSTEYDVIVVGARCAGSPTGMLLARKGYRVLVVDRSTFPSDTLSTHLIHPVGVAALHRWGLLDAVTATNCPPISLYSFNFGPFTISGSPRASDGVIGAFGPRRLVLDKILVDGAADAGAEVREKFTVEDLVTDGDGLVTGIRGHEAGGTTVTESARVVVGADGRNSKVAEMVAAVRYHEKPALQGSYYAYWSGLPASGFEAFIRPGRGWGVIPTNDDLTLVVVGVARSDFDAYRRDVESVYLQTLEQAPEFAERVRGASRQTRFAGTGDLPNFFRQPYGPGWALVGDAGYHKDPITAFGISDAFHNAELLAQGLDESLSARRSFNEAMAAYQTQRDEAALPMFELTAQFAAMEPPPPEMQHLLGAVHGNQDAMDDFASMMAGTLPVPQFFAPENIGRLMSNAHR